MPSTILGATGYSVERKEGSGEFREIATPSSISYTDADLSPEAYTYRVKVKGTTPESYSNEVGVSIIAAKPNPAQNLRGNLFSENSDSIRLEWDPPAVDASKPYTGFQLFQSKAGAAETSADIDGKKLTHGPGDFTYIHFVSGFDACTVYEFWIAVKGPAGTSEISNKISITTREADGTDTCPGTRPGDIATLTLTADQFPPRAIISLVWGVSADADNYNVEREDCDVAGDYVTIASSITGNTYTDNSPCGIKTGGPETYRVAGNNSVGLGTWKTETIVLPQAEVVGSPTNLRFTRRSTSAPGDSILDFTWTKPADGGIVTSYKFQRSSSRTQEGQQGESWTANEELVLIDDDTTPLVKEDVKIPRGDSVYFRVVANNIRGDGDQPTNVVAVFAAVTDVPVNVPSAPDKPTAVKSDNGKSITVTWKAPAAGGSPITGYDHERTVDGTAETPKSVSATVLSFTDDAVDAESRYKYRVRAKNANGDGNWSAFTEEIIGGLDSEVSTKVKGLQATGGDKQISLRWTTLSVEDRTIKHYQVQVRHSSSGDNFANLAEALSNSYLHTGLGVDVERWYRVRADFTDDTSGTWSDIAVAKTTTGEDTTTTTPTDSLPDAPTSLTATLDEEDEEIDLAWTAPDSGSAKITGYRIEVAIGAGSWQDLSANTNSTTTTYKHTGIDPLKVYKYRVSAINEHGTSPSSNVASTEATILTVPTAPVNLTATSAASGITLQWQPPSNDGGIPLTGYLVESSDDKVGWTSLVAVDVETTSYTHRDPPAGEEIHYRVRAGKWRREWSTVQCSFGNWSEPGTVRTSKLGSAR